MKRREERYKEIIENLNDAVYTVDLKTLTFTSVNIVGEKLTGYRRPELLKTHITKVIPPEYLPLVKKMIAKKRNNDASTIYEIEIVKKNGTRVPVEISSRAIYENEVPVEILGIARDISERKMHEQQRNIFISLIAHEIKNPLTSIKLYTELLTKHIKHDEKAQSFLKPLGQQMDTIEQLVKEFLDINHMRMGKFTIKKEKFNLNDVIDETISTYAASTNHKIVKKGKMDFPVIGDRERICQVLSNLISNAIKYSPDESEIIISASKTKTHITVNVQDFGNGISKAEQKRIFELFFRTKYSEESNVNGHGLGLYICQEIIKRHKGKLWVESKETKGSIFYFTLPLK